MRVRQVEEFMEFNIRDFHYQPENHTFVAEASSLTIRSNRTGSVRRFNMYRCDYDAEQDLRFVEYQEDAGEFTAIVFND